MTSNIYQQKKIELFSRIQNIFKDFRLGVARHLSRETLKLTSYLTLLLSLTLTGLQATPIKVLLISGQTISDECR